MKEHLIRAVIIDDEPYSSELLSIYLGMDNPDVKIEAICGNATEGLTAIQKFSPDLIFLDVQMPKMNGFEMLEKLHGSNVHVIFTTSYDVYAVQAFRHKALDYLLKPVDRQELILAIGKVREKMNAQFSQQMMYWWKKYSDS